MMFLKSTLTLFLASNASAFFVSPGLAPRPFVYRHVSLSTDPTLSTDTPSESNDAVDASLGRPTAPEDRHTVYVGNLPYGITLIELREMFEQHIECGYINMPRNEASGEIKGFAFVEVKSEDAILKAVEALNGKELGDRPLRVSKVLPKEQIRSKKTNQAPNKNKLFVGNLPFKATVEDIKELFSQYGELTDVFIPVDSVGEPRGFGFVTCAEGNVDAILENCNGIELLGRRLTVNPPLAPGEKEEKRNRTGPARGSKKKLYIGNLSFYTTEETLLDVFSEFGKVHDAYIPQDNDRGGSRGFGFVTMDSDAALNAIDGLDGCEIDDRIIAVNEAQMKRKNSAGYGEDEESP